MIEPFISIPQRSAPAVFIHDLQGLLQYTNGAARAALTALPEPDRESLRAACQELCRRAREGGEPPAASWLPAAPEPDGSWSLRAFPLAPPLAPGPPSHVLLLLERCAFRRRCDLEQACAAYHLSRREAEVLGHLCQGLGNRQIAQALGLSEHTVKAHLESLMKKLGATRRSEVLAQLR